MKPGTRLHYDDRRRCGRGKTPGLGIRDAGIRDPITHNIHYIKHINCVIKATFSIYFHKMI